MLLTTDIMSMCDIVRWWWKVILRHVSNVGYDLIIFEKQLKREYNTHKRFMFKNLFNHNCNWLFKQVAST